MNAAAVINPIKGYTNLDRNSSCFTSFFANTAHAFIGWEIIATTHFMISLYIFVHF